MAQNKIYFGIHKHMHQPYYRAADEAFWDGEKEEIFGSRKGPYVDFIAEATRRYAEGKLPHAGLSTSWSGSLIEQLDRCERDGLCGGAFENWTERLREAAREKTANGNPRVDFTAFGHFHPLMPLIPPRNIRHHLEWHRHLIRDRFGVEPGPMLFPPETAFHTRMIPALKEAGVEAVMVDSIHRYRTCREYPYAGPSEGMLPPNGADQVNPPVDDWFRVSNIWTGSEISARLLKPEVAIYEDPDGQEHRIIVIPAERYIGNEDARGGFGALLYEDVFDQLYRHLDAHDGFDPEHPPFFLLHSDGDNHGGGAESYYTSNTERLVEWLQGDPRFELTTVRDYLDRFPPDEDNPVHIEPGSWAGADNGDPQFMKWFSRYDEPYSPDLNSWAVLTALQNAVHTLEDADGGDPGVQKAVRRMLMAETSCYWYWTGQDVWDRQVTEGANDVYRTIGAELDAVVNRGVDTTPPTIFPPWVIPENPGGKTWGEGGLCDADRTGVVHTFIDDISGIARAEMVMRIAGREERVALADRGAYPSRTGPDRIAHLYTAELPAGAGDIRYWIEAEDGKGNVARGALERIFCA